MDRFNVGLPRPAADRVRTLAAQQRQSNTTTITNLVTAALTNGEHDVQADEERVQASPLYRRVLEEKEALVLALSEARRELAQRRHAPAAVEVVATPRWAWPLDALLGDEEWWRTWLPRLNELMGSSPTTIGVAGRGYLDVMEYLFPPAGDVTWHSPDYRAAAQTDRPGEARLSSPAISRADAWEPVVRHVARALATLEEAEQPGADAYRTLQAVGEITGPWVDVLRRLLGDSPANLPVRRSA